MSELSEYIKANGCDWLELEQSANPPKQVAEGYDPGAGLWTKTCPMCHKVFQAKRGNQMYCDKRCLKRATYYKHIDYNNTHTHKQMLLDQFNFAYDLVVLVNSKLRTGDLDAAVLAVLDKYYIRIKDKQEKQDENEM